MNDRDAQIHADVVELIRIEMGEVACGNHGNEERLASLIQARLGATQRIALIQKLVEAGCEVVNSLGTDERILVATCERLKEALREAGADI